MIQRKEVRETSKSFAAENGNRTTSGRRPFLSKQELALAVRVSPRTIDNWTAEKRIPFLRFSARLIRFDLDRVLGALTRDYQVIEVGGKRK